MRAITRAELLVPFLLRCNIILYEQEVPSPQIMKKRYIIVLSSSLSLLLNKTERRWSNSQFNAQVCKTYSWLDSDKVEHDKWCSVIILCTFTWVCLLNISHLSFRQQHSLSLGPCFYGSWEGTKQQWGPESMASIMDENNNNNNKTVSIFFPNYYSAV